MIIMAEAYVLLKVSPGDERNIVRLLNELPEVKDINELYGEWDIIIKVAVKNIEELDPLLSENIRVIKGVELTSTMIVAKYSH
jgi:DNA-binding Lrp family transcriptional regulator